jgi:hypothetical protein
MNSGENVVSLRHSVSVNPANIMSALGSERYVHPVCWKLLRLHTLPPRPAPTGSGKTVLFELSIIYMLINSSGHGAAEKCVYVAPTKVCLLALFDAYPLKRRRRCALRGPGTGQKNSDSLA